MLTETDRESSTVDASAAPHRFRFPLPFDPIRLLAGILTRWHWLVAGMVVFGVLGAIAGMAMTQQKFSLSVSLMKRRVTQTVQTSEVGQAYRPTDLNDATLLATLLASEPRDIAFKRADNGVTLDQAASCVEASQLENTDIFFITYHSPVGPDDAVRVGGILAEEISEYTKRLQQSEARSVLSILSKEVAGLEKRIRDTNQEILEFAKSHDYIGGEAQVTAVLGKLSQVELQLEDTRATEKSLRAQLDELEKKIRHHSPLNLRLRAAREELAELRATYTDENPLVATKLESIMYLENQIKELDAGEEMTMESFTGTPLGNQIYLDIMAVRNRLAEAVNRLGTLEEQRKAAAERLATFPAIISQYDALRIKRDSYISELSLMSKRLKEAEIFASGSPGYWQIFQPPDHRNVVPSSLTKKPIMLGAVGAIGGLGFSLVVTFLLTHRTTRRSVLECCATTHASLTALLPNDPERLQEWGNLWISTLAPSYTDEHGLILLWTNALDPAEERVFWERLAAAAQKDTQSPLQVIDLSPDALWQSVEPSPALHWSGGNAKAVGRAIMRASALPAMSQRQALSGIRRWYAVVSGQKLSLQTYAANRHLTEVYLEPCSGTIVLSDPADGPIRSIADRVSIFLTQRFS